MTRPRGFGLEEVVAQLESAGHVEFVIRVEFEARSELHADLELAVAQLPRDAQGKAHRADRFIVLGHARLEAGAEIRDDGEIIAVVVQDPLQVEKKGRLDDEAFLLETVTQGQITGQMLKKISARIESDGFP